MTEYHAAKEAYLCTNNKEWPSRSPDKNRANQETQNKT
jgi:hypothetical protein